MVSFGVISPSSAFLSQLSQPSLRSSAGLSQNDAQPCIREGLRKSAQPLNLNVGHLDFRSEVELSHKLLLVDFENVQQVDLSRLENNFHVVIFVVALVAVCGNFSAASGRGSPFHSLGFPYLIGGWYTDNR